MATSESKSPAARTSTSARKAPVTKTPAAKAAKRRPRKPAVDPGAHVEFWEAWAETKSSDSSAPAPDEEDESPDLAAAAPASDVEDGAKKKRRRRTRKPRGEESEESEESEEFDASTPTESAADDAGVKESETESEANDAGSVRLFVNVGKREDADADEIMAFLSEAVGEKAEGLGRITLRNTHCYVRVDSDIADEVIEACTGLVFKEREMVVERAKR
jgi:ATP-dependent RNA helicase DeaD